MRGGEGATKLITVRVAGARSDADAKRAARAIANSLLVKTAIHGGDPNWGRLVAVAGRAGAAFSLDRAVVRIGSIELFSGGGSARRARAGRRGVPHGTRHRRDSSISARAARGSPAIWTCDLSAEYVRINAEYRT